MTSEDHEEHPLRRPRASPSRSRPPRPPRRLTSPSSSPSARPSTPAFVDSCWVKHGQTDSWPAIFARQAGVSGFQQPIIGEPGLGPCQILTSLAPTFKYAPNTGKPENLTLPRPYDNLAIPGYLGASVVNCVTNTGNASVQQPLIDLVLRGSGATVLQQAASLKPTFFAIGVLGNELLGPATSGTVIDGVTLISKEAYAASYKTIVDTMKAAQGGTGKGHRADDPGRHEPAVLHGRQARSSASTRRRTLRSTSSGRRAAPRRRPGLPGAGRHDRTAARSAAS